MDHPIPLALTYDDVLLVPKYSPVRSRKEVSTFTRLSRNINLKIPIVASNMDTVTESQTAIVMAREGGIGILHRFCSIEEQCEMVAKVKRAQSLLIEDPRTILPTDSITDAQTGLNWTGRSGGVRSLLVINNPQERKLVGIVTAKDLQFVEHPNANVGEVMTPLDKMVVSTNPKINLSEAKALMMANRTSNIPVVDDNGVLMGLVTDSDVNKLTKNRVASLDNKSRLLVGAAVGVKAQDLARAQALVKAGVDVLVVDIAHGHSSFCLDMVRKLKADSIVKHIDIIAGNIASADGARDLIAAGADGLKVGVGPGSICITRLVAGSGVPQLTAIMEVAKVARKHGVPIIADGGVKTAGDIGKAVAAGADTVMLGNMLAGTDESPGRVLVKDGKKVKIIRGMAGYGANISKAEREKQTDDDVFLDMTPEGVEGNVPYKGPLGPIVRQLVGGLRSGMSYCGAVTFDEMRKNASFVRMTPSGLRESGPHDISKL